jgi:hypothetical protein
MKFRYGAGFTLKMGLFIINLNDEQVEVAADARHEV